MTNGKKSLKEESEYAALLSFIENNASKEDFVTWLNTQQGRTYSEEDTWERLKTEVSGEEGVNLSEIKTYAQSLGEEQDVEHLLRSVKETTQEAERTAERLSYLSHFKKFSVAVGGALIFAGIFLFAIAGLLIFHTIGDGLAQNIQGIAINIFIFIGILNVLAGLLLATR